MNINLNRLLRPKSIAIIGGGLWCFNAIQKCKQIGFEGDIFVVHPKKEEFAGIKCIPSVTDLPFGPDASFIGVNRHSTIEILRQLNAIGAGGAVCFASGFLESQAEDGAGAQLQNDLLNAAGDMAVLGPNCYGFVNYLDRAVLWPDEHGGKPVDRGVAVVTQSSNIAINLTMQKRGLPIAYMVTAGNQAQTGLSEIGTSLLHDPRVTALGLHIEGIDNLRAFEKLAKTAHELGKRIVAIKVGKSEQAQSATITHTASLAGSDAGANAMLARLGIARVDSLSAFLEALKILHTVGGLANSQIGSMSCSGGEASLVADAGMDLNVGFPVLTKPQTRDLGNALGPMVGLSNPLDYHTYVWGDHAQMTKVFAGMLAPHLGIGLLTLDVPRGDRCDPTAWTDVIGSVVAARDQTGVAMGVLASLGETMPEDVAYDLIAQGIVPFNGVDEALNAIAAIGNLKEFDPSRAMIAHDYFEDRTTTLFEADAKDLLNNFGVNIPTKDFAISVEHAQKIASGVGFPVVVKGHGIEHKTEAAAVALGLMSFEEVGDAARSMPTDEFLVEQMITGGVAELLIGVVLDPAHGYVLTLAAGGILTELMKDSHSMLLPITRSEVGTALQILKIAPLLNGYRGKRCANIDAIVDCVMQVQTCILDDNTAIVELEINPLICTPDRVYAVDALIKTGVSHDR